MKLLPPGLFVLSILLAASALGTPHASAEVDPELRSLHPETMEKSPRLIELETEWGNRGKDRSLADRHLEAVRAELAKDPDNVELIRHYIEVALDAGAQAPVTKEMEERLDRKPKDAASYYFLGLLETGSAALERFDRALEIDPDFYYALVAKADQRLATRRDADLQEARTVLLKAARLRPDQPLAYLGLSEVYGWQGDLDSRVEALEMASVADPWSPSTRRKLLEALQQMGQDARQSGKIEEWATRSTDVLDRVGRVGPGDPEMLFLAGKIRASLGHNDEALASLQAAADLGFDDPRRIRSERSLAPLMKRPEFASILEKVQENQLRSSPEIKEDLEKHLIHQPLPPNVEFPLLSGGSVRLSDLKGKVVILDFWATWCGPCRMSLPLLQSFYVEKPKNVEVYCVNVFERDGGKKVAPFWKSAGYPMPVALGNREHTAEFGVRSIPFLFVIDQKGEIRYTHRGHSPDLPETLRLVSEILLDGG
jgi:thiol-disulfide isomerase/thioredoxin/tetratricopeptide (TPR) repeat protein